MVKLKNKAGESVIISDETSFIDSLFKDYFGNKTDGKDFVIISISPSLLSENDSSL